MKIKVNNKPLPSAEKIKHKEQKELKKQFGEYDLKSVMKYIRKLEKRIEALEQK